jgi:rSAM/selenodomain-associated transferase 2
LLREQLLALQALRKQGHEILVVDGGSKDGSESVSAGLADLLVSAPRGRAVQMNRGAARASGEILLFLHVDSRLPEGAMESILEALSEPSRLWGRFDVRLSGDRWLFRVIATCMNLRSHFTGIVTGDQGLFVRRQVFEQAGGYAAVPLMEDVDLSRRLRRRSWPVRLRRPLVTSSRRWEQQGAVRTILMMWWLRLRYFLGDSPENLARIYYKK